MGIGLIVILGKQGAGKGTQCARLADRYGVPHVATGDILRAAVKSDSPLGREVKNVMRAGLLVSDQLITEVVAERLGQPDAADGAILDGYPRTAPQAAALAAIVGADGIAACIELAVPTEVVIARLSARRVCSDCGAIYSADPGPAPEHCTNCGGTVVQRADDSPDAIAERLAIYEQDTVPLIEHYAAKGQLTRIDGDGPSDEVFARLTAVIDRISG